MSKVEIKSKVEMQAAIPWLTPCQMLKSLP